jgi:hypothetical protein
MEDDIAPIAVRFGIFRAWAQHLSTRAAARLV